MAKTLVIKLAETVDNANLSFLGELDITIRPSQSTWKKVAPTQYTQDIVIANKEPITMRLEGDGHFTDSTLEQNLGTTITKPAGESTIYVSDGNSKLRITNKYAITKIQMGTGANGNQEQHFHWTLNLAQLTGMTELAFYNSAWGGSSGNFSALGTLSKLTYIGITDCYLLGDISVLRDMTQLTNIRLFNCTGIGGDISNLAGLTELTSVNVANVSSLTGDTSSLAHLHPNNGGKLTAFSYSSIGITGDWPPSA